MQLTVKNNFANSQTAVEIYQQILNTRELDPHPPRPKLAGLVKSLGLSKQSLAAAKSLIDKHLHKGSDILIYGDYDVDGITATAIIYSALVKLSKGTKARVLPFIPDRVRHGYGLSAASLKDIFSGTAFVATAYPDFVPSLVITVDNGIVAHKELTVLRDKGIDTLITDHHQLGQDPLPATCLIHSTTTSGAGLAWVAALALTDSSPDAASLIELATIGIVADLLPLTGVNRQIVTHGLEALSQTTRPGLRALMRFAGLEAGKVTASHLAFRLAPRLNAAGRLADATDALRLLVTASRRQAVELAEAINSHNQERQALTEQGIAHALQSKPKHKLIIAVSEDYHEGVIGLIASRLAEHYHRPAVVISQGEKVSKGSARSVNGINITNLLRQFDSSFISLGGHELAAGFSIKTPQLDSVSAKLLSHADQTIDSALLVKNYIVEGELTLKQTSLTLARLLRSLAPFGMGNPTPTFVSRGLTVLEARPVGKDGAHHKLTLEAAGTTREAIWFNSSVKKTPRRLNEVIYTLDINTWRGKDSLQLIIKHATL